MSIPDPLLPLPDMPLNLPQELSGEDQLKAAFVSASDHVNLHAMAWPAKDRNGRLVPPPAEHVLHDLAHAYSLVEEERLFESPRLGDVTVVTELPECGMCVEKGRYDAIVEVRGEKAGAFLCNAHYLEYGSGTLGASGDTYLMLFGEVPQSVQKDCNILLEAQGRQPMF